MHRNVCQLALITAGRSFTYLLTTTLTRTLVLNVTNSSCSCWIRQCTISFQ